MKSRLSPLSAPPFVVRAGGARRRSGPWAGLAVAMLAAALFVSMLVARSRIVRPVEPLRMGVSMPALVAFDRPLPPPAPESSACADRDASGAHQFIELEETIIVGTPAPDDEPVAPPRR